MSSYLVIENFQGGLDTRKSRLAAPAGTLTEGLDGHITPGGEFEKRKAFVALVNPDELVTSSLPANTFGLQPVAGGLLVFGSADPTGMQFPDDADGNAISYQRLQHPAVLAGESYSAGSHAMTEVVHSEVFGGLAFVIAKYADGNQFCYYDGDLVEDFTAGLILPYLVGNNPKIATAAKNLVDALADYSAALVGPFTTTHRAHSGTTATLTIGTHNLQIGNRVWVTGIATAGYNVTNAAITAVTATTISYATGVTLTEGTTAEVGGTVQTALLDIDGGLGVDYTMSAENDSSAGTVSGPTNTVSPVTPVSGVAATGAFTISGGSADGVAAASATGSIVTTGTNPIAGKYVQIGKKKYTFQTTLSVEGDVKIGANAAATLINLQRAINHTGTPGTDYVCAAAHPWVQAGTISGSTLPLTAYAGTQGNSIGLVTGDVTYFTVSGAAMTGGAGNCIGSVKVVSPTGTQTELLTAAVLFTSNAAATAALVRDAIVANSGTSGYTATVNGATVTVLSSAAASPMPNDYHLQVAGGGNVLVGECLFYLTQQATTFSLSNILVDGLDCLAGAEAFPQTGSGGIAVDTFPEYYAELVYVINSRSGITGINAWTNGEYVKLSRITTRDDDQPLAVYITPAAANTVGIVFGTPPALAVPLTVKLPGLVSAVGSQGVLGVNSAVNLSAAIVAELTGGNGLFTYEWFAEYSGQDTGTLGAYYANQFGPLPQYGLIQFTYTIAITPNNSRAVAVVFKTNSTPGSFNSGLGINAVDIQPFTARFALRCRVTDSFGNKATSDACIVEFQIT